MPLQPPEPATMIWFPTAATTGSGRQAMGGGACCQLRWSGSMEKANLEGESM